MVTKDGVFLWKSSLYKVKESTSLNGPPRCYDLLLRNYKNNFIQTTGFSDFYKMTFTIL